MEVEGSDEVGILPADAVATSATFVVWFKLLNQAQREKLQFCHVLENLILTSIASSSLEIGCFPRQDGSAVSGAGG